VWIVSVIEAIALPPLLLPGTVIDLVPVATMVCMSGAMTLILTVAAACMVPVLSIVAVSSTVVAVAVAVPADLDSTPGSATVGVATAMPQRAKWTGSFTESQTAHIEGPGEVRSHMSTASTHSPYIA
jgi:hypothetical protein